MASAEGFVTGLRAALHVHNARMTVAEKAVQIGVTDPDEAFALRTLRFRIEASMESRDNASQIRPTIAVASNAFNDLVRTPRIVGGVVDERERVLGHREVRVGARDLENVSAFSGRRNEDGNPKDLDEKMGPEQHAHAALVFRGAAFGDAKETRAVPSLRRRGLDVVLEHEATRRRHRGLGFVR